MRWSQKVFLDTSVVITSLLSNRGPGSAIFDLARLGRITIIMTEIVVVEAYEAVKRKYPQKQADLATFLSEFQKSVKPSPTFTELQKFSGVISDPDDRHILAGATKYKVDTLITHDRHHFLTPAMQQANFGFTIETPGQFMKRYRTELEQLA